VTLYGNTILCDSLDSLSAMTRAEGSPTGIAEGMNQVSASGACWTLSPGTLSPGVHARVLDQARVYGSSDGLTTVHPAVLLLVLDGEQAHAKGWARLPRDTKADVGPTPTLRDAYPTRTTGY
jgi:hypothetical protein